MSEIKPDGTHTYTFSAGIDSNNPTRDDAVTITGTTSHESQRIIPLWLPCAADGSTVGDIIYAVKATTHVVDGSSNPVSYLMIAPWRLWAHYS